MKGLLQFNIVVIIFMGGMASAVCANSPVPKPPSAHILEKGIYLYENGWFLQASRYLDDYLDNHIEEETHHNFEKKAYYYRTLTDIALDSLHYHTYIRRYLKKFPSGEYAISLLEEMAARDFRNENFNNALDVFQKAYTLETETEDKARFLYWMAESAKYMEKPDSASVLYQEVADNYSDSRLAPRALYARGQLYLEREKFDESSLAFELLRKRFPHHDLTRQIGSALGEIYYRQDRFEDAVSVLSSELPYLEDNAMMKAILLIAESYNYLGQFDRAASHYRRYIHLSKDEMQARPAHYGLGWVYHKQRVFHWAADSFDKAAIGKDEIARKALYYKAINRKLSGRFDLALSAFETFGERFNTGFWVETTYYEWALTAFQTGRYDLSIDVLQRLLRSGEEIEDPGRVYTLLGEAYFANNEFSRAEQAFIRAEETTDVDPEMKQQAQFQRAWILYENQAFADAAGAFDAVYRAQPSGNIAAESLFWSADSYFNLRQWNRAARQFKRFIDGYPNHSYIGAAVYSLAWSHFNRREYELAANYFERFITYHEPPPMALFPYDVDTRLRLGDSYYALGKYDQAIVHYEKAAGASVGGDYALFQKANSHFRKNDSFEAVQNFRRLTRIYPESRLREQSRFNIGFIFFRVGNYDQAIREFHELINRHPGSTWAARSQYQIGDAYYNAGKYEDAIEAYQTLMNNYPESAYVVDAVNGIQFSRMAQGKEDNSLEILEEFLQNHPQTEMAENLRFRQAETLFQTGDYTEAIRSFRHYIRVTTSERRIPDAWYQIGEAKEQLGEYRLALDAFRQIAESYPNTPPANPALLHMGRLSLELGEYDEAINAYETLVARESRLQAEALSGLGDASYAARRFSDAENAYQRALEIRKNDETALIGLGKTAVQRGRYLDAQRYFSQVSENNTMEKGAEATYRLGRMEQQRRRYQEAIDIFSKVPVLFEVYEKWVAKSMLGLADSYRAMGRNALARRAYQDVIDRFPETSYAETAAQQL